MLFVSRVYIQFSLIISILRFLNAMYPNTIVLLSFQGQLPAIRMMPTRTILELSRLFRSLADPALVAMICKVNV